MSVDVSPKRLVGFNYPSAGGGWGADVLGILLGEFEEGWMEVGSHISSSTGWAQNDIGGHAKRDFEGIPYEWVGELPASDPPAPEVAT